MFPQTTKNPSRTFLPRKVHKDRIFRFPMAPSFVLCNTKTTQESTVEKPTVTCVYNPSLPSCVGGRISKLNLSEGRSREWHPCALTSTSNFFDVGGGKTKTSTRKLYFKKRTKTKIFLYGHIVRWNFMKQRSTSWPSKWNFPKFSIRVLNTLYVPRLANGQQYYLNPHLKTTPISKSENT